MGFIGNFLKTIFKPKIPTASFQQIQQTQQTQLTGRDILSSTESEEPESPVMGSEKKKRKGIESLMVPSERLYHGGK